MKENEQGDMVVTAGGWVASPELAEVIWGQGGDSGKKFLWDKVTNHRRRWDQVGDRLELVGTEVSYAGDGEG